MYLCVCVHRINSFLADSHMWFLQSESVAIWQLPPFCHVLTTPDATVLVSNTMWETQFTVDVFISISLMATDLKHSFWYLVMTGIAFCCVLKVPRHYSYVTPCPENNIQGLEYACGMSILL